MSSSGSYESLDLSNGSEDTEASEYLDCGLPVEEDLGDGHCRGCFAAFSEHDEVQLGLAWQELVIILQRRGYRAAVPSMDRHFERVFFLLVKDWQGRIGDVGFMYDSDAEFVPSEEEEEETDSDE